MKQESKRRLNEKREGRGRRTKAETLALISTKGVLQILLKGERFDR